MSYLQYSVFYIGAFVWFVAGVLLIVVLLLFDWKKRRER